MSLVLKTVAQDEHPVIGVLVDSATRQPVQFAHVTNYSTNQLTVTNAQGRFRIPASVGDTIVFSIVGYQTLGWITRQEWLDKEISLALPQDTLLLNDVIVQNIPTEEIFKRKILNYQPEDTSFWYHGMPLPVAKEDPMLNEKTIKNPLYMATHPLSAMYYNFSKQEKEKRKYHRVIQNEHREQRVYAKFSREWVHEVTALEGNELTDFIFYCDYSLDYLDKTPLYLIREDLLAKLTEFKRDQRG